MDRSFGGYQKKKVAHSHIPSSRNRARYGLWAIFRNGLSGVTLRTGGSPCEHSLLMRLWRYFARLTDQRP